MKKVIIFMIGVLSVAQQFAGDESKLSITKRKIEQLEVGSGREVRQKTAKSVSFADVVAETKIVVPIYHQRHDLFFDSSVESSLGQLDDIIKAWARLVENANFIEDKECPNAAIERLFISLGEDVDREMVDDRLSLKERIVERVNRLKSAMSQVKDYISIYNNNDQQQILATMKRLIVDAENALKELQESLHLQDEADIARAWADGLFA